MGSVVVLKQDDIIIRFLDMYKSEKTIRAYVGIYKDFFQVNDINLITEYKIKNITYQDAQTYIKSLTETKSKNTIIQRIGALRALFNYAIDEKLIDINPFADRRIKLIVQRNCEKNEEIGRALSITEIKQLVSTIENDTPKTPKKKIQNQRDKTLIIFILRTGCRKEETISLTRENIIYNAIEEKYYIKIIGKGNKIRYVQLTNNTIEELNKLEKKNTLFGIKDETLINKILNKWSERANLGHIQVHDLRRTFATNLIKNGIDIYTLKELMGHSSIQTTSKYFKNEQKFNQNLDQYITW